MLSVALAISKNGGYFCDNAIDLKSMFIRTVVTLLRLHLQHLVFYKKKGRIYNHGPSSYLRLCCRLSLRYGDR
jgi:hypothetical protein